MRVTALIPIVALLAGVTAAPVPNPNAAPVAEADPWFWSLKCGLFGWRCPPQNNVEPVPTTTTPPPQPTTPTPQPTTPTPEPTTPQPTASPTAPSSTVSPPAPTETDNGCLTADFCPDNSHGEGGNPGEGDGTVEYPNGTRPQGRAVKREEEVEARAVHHEFQKRNVIDNAHFSE